MPGCFVSFFVVTRLLSMVHHDCNLKVTSFANHCLDLCCVCLLPVSAVLCPHHHLLLLITHHHQQMGPAETLNLTTFHYILMAHLYVKSSV